MNENQYDMLQNENGDILIIIGKHGGEPQNPKLYYNGDDLLVLRKNDKTSIALRNLDKDVKKALNQVGGILIIEVEDEEVVQEYNVSLRIKKDLEW